MAPTAPVLAVLVCHDGQTWLSDVLEALGRLTRRPRWVVAVDTGSTDATPRLLAASNRVDVVLTLSRETGFAAAITAAVTDADRRWGRPGTARDPRNSSGDWVWILHDDAAPEPDCLDVLLSVADASPAAAVLGPLQLDWDDPRLVVEAGLSTDAAGHRETGIGADELDLGQFATNSEVLAVGSAGSLVRRHEWDALGGYDQQLALLREDVDYGWRVNAAGGLVLCVPSARLRHARALTTSRRALDAAGVDRRFRATDRAHGMATLLTNTTGAGYALGLLRLPVVQVLRALGFLLARRARAAGAEIGALVLLLAGLGSISTTRASRPPGEPVRGLLTTRTTRVRNAVRGGLTSVVRRRLSAELALGRLPEWAERTPGRPVAPQDDGGELLVGPGALPAGVLPPPRSAAGRSMRRAAGLRRPGESIGVALAGAPSAPSRSDPSPSADPDGAPGAVPGAIPTPRRSSPAPGPAGAPGAPATAGTGAVGAAAVGAPAEQVVLVPVTAGRVARELLLAPPLLLVLALGALSVLVHRARLGLDLSGGRMLPVAPLGELWSTYLAEWHPVAGGTAAPAPAALAVLGVLGAMTAPLGGPPAAAALLVLGALPLAGLTAYLASRPLRVGRVVRALTAAVYALLGTTGAAVAQGRLDGVVAVVLLPPVLAGVASVLQGRPVQGRRGSWWSTAAGTALALGVVSAFAPLVHVLVLVVVLLGFVVVPSPAGAAGRRAVALALVVVLPVLLLLPWPTVLLRTPQVLLHGTGSPVPEAFAEVLDVLSLDAGGAGSLPFVGLVLVAVVVVGAFVAPRREALPGLAVLVLGIVAAGMVGSIALPPVSGGDARPGWTGPALAFAACGGLWSLLAQVAAARSQPLGELLGRRDRPARPAPASQRLAGAEGDPELDLGPEGVAAGLGRVSRAAVSRVGGTMAVLGRRFRRRTGGDAGARARGLAVPVLTASVVVLALLGVLRGGAGPLTATAPPALEPAQAAGLAAAGASAVVVALLPGGAASRGGPAVAPDPDRTRRVGPRLPRWGDDDLTPVGAAPARLQRDVTALLSGDPATVQAAVGELATGGSGVIVLPDAGTATRVRRAAGPLLAEGPATSDGRPTVRVALPVAGAVVLEPPISDDATDAEAAPRRPAGITPVPAVPPTVAVRVSPGADRRVLVLAAERESGWTATVGGANVAITSAWGHLVGVPLPAGGGPVVVDRDATLRALLLLAQLALVLFTALSALPSRRRLD